MSIDAALRGDRGVDSRRRRAGDEGDAMLTADPAFFRIDLFFRTASMLGESWTLLRSERGVWLREVTACCC